MSVVVPEKNTDLTFAAGDVLVWVGTPNENPPTDAMEDPEDVSGANYRCVGWVDTSGYLFKLDASTKEIPAAGTLSSIRTIITGGSKTVQFTCLEAMNPYARALYDDVPIFPVTTMDLKPISTTINIASYVLPDPPGDNRYGMIFDAIDGDKVNRLYAPNCKVTNRGNDQLQQADIESLEMTVTMYPGVIGAESSIVGKRWLNYGAADVANYFLARS